ncbi:MAG: tetratricopeptide repeat protein [Wenzhouxiangella sp.]|nr:MAG: tetratricopeptide repeat protein [Wenzhouxiangella sp.]
MISAFGQGGTRQLNTVTIITEAKNATDRKLSVKGIVINERLIDLDTGELRHHDKSEQLPPRLLGLLNFLIENPNRVLTRDELIVAVWGHLEAASDDSVNVAISSLRQRIGDSRRPYRVLKAIPRRGYLFDSSRVRRVQVDDPDATIEAISLPAGRAPGFAWMKAAGIGLVLLAGLAGAWWLVDFGSEPAVTGESLPEVSLIGQENGFPHGRAVAILPFTDMSVGGDQGPFADGLVDRIIHKLTLSPDLDVVARTSTFAFRDSSADIREIGERLQVDVVLEGSVQQADNTVRVLAQLINARNGMHIWSQTYDRPIRELFELQDDIANAVARTMTNTLLPDRASPGPESRRVWELVTRGRLALDAFTLASATEAAEYFRQAIELQPDNVEALIGLVDALRMQRSHGPVRSSEDVDMTEVYLNRAQRVAPDSHQVIRARADWHVSHSRPDEAIAGFERAIALNPNDAVAFRNLGRALFRQTHYDEALDVLRTAVRLDPFSELGNVWLADAYWAVGRAEEAMYRLRQILADRPDFVQAHDRIATYLVQVGQSGEAMRHILRVRELDPDSPTRWFRKCEFYLHLGDDDSAEACTEELLAEHDLPFLGRYLRQILHGFRGAWAEHTRELEAIYALGNPEPLTRSLLGQAHSRDNCDRSLEVLEEAFPEVFDDPPKLNPNLFMAAKTATYCLQEHDRHDQAGPLLAAMTEVIERTRLERGPWLISGHEEAQLLALKGEYDAALDSLEALIDSGWRYYWWGLDGYYPEFAAIVDHPRFVAMVERLEAGVRAQREYFEAHRDQPLH